MPSIYEITKYSKSTETYESKDRFGKDGNSRTRIPTDFAKANSTCEFNPEYGNGIGCDWWLRSPNSLEYAAYISAGGYVSGVYGSYVNSKCGVVPALCVSF